jgi:hypothetical protein
MDAERYWQIRIPLGGRQFVNIVLDPAQQVPAVVQASFPKLLESYFRSTFPASAEEVLDFRTDNVPR